MSLVTRTVASALWATTANVAVVLVVAVRSVLLARLLPVEVFGVYALAGAVVALTSVLAGFGLAGAFLHRARETDDEAHAAAVHFTITLVFSFVWAAALLSCTAIFASGPLALALGVLTITQLGLHLAMTPQILLVRNVTHRRLAVVRVLNAAVATAAALYLAWSEVGIWSLLAIDVSTAALTVTALYGWRPVWRPRLAWRARTIRYFLGFGSRTLIGQALEEALQRIDKLWIAIFMDKLSLGLYSRAYAYAQAPMGFVSGPIASVIQGTYAELKGDSRRLSSAVFQVSSFLVRVGFLLGGLMALASEELIHFLIGEKWLPMLDAFRILIVAFLCHPLMVTLSKVALAMGLPATLARIRLGQVVVLAGCLALLTPSLELVGASLSILAASLLGLGALLKLVRLHLDFSLKRLFLAPALSLVAALSLGVATDILLSATLPAWQVLCLKTVLFLGVFLLMSFALERREISKAVAAFRRHLAHSRRTA